MPVPFFIPGGSAHETVIGSLPGSSRCRRTGWTKAGGPGGQHDQTHHGQGPSGGVQLARLDGVDRGRRRRRSVRRFRGDGHRGTVFEALLGACSSNADRGALLALRTNLASLELESRTTVVTSDVMAWIPAMRGVDLVLVDPPYTFDAWPQLLQWMQVDYVVCGPPPRCSARRPGRPALQAVRPHRGHRARPGRVALGERCPGASVDRGRPPQSR